MNAPQPPLLHPHVSPSQNLRGYQLGAGDHTHQAGERGWTVVQQQPSIQRHCALLVYPGSGVDEAAEDLRAGPPVVALAARIPGVYLEGSSLVPLVLCLYLFSFLYYWFICLGNIVSRSGGLLSQF